MPGPRTRRWFLRLLGLALVVLGLLALGTVGGYWGYRTWAVSNLGRLNKEASASSRLTAPSLAALLQANADSTTPLRLRIPRIGVDSPVEEVGTEWKEAVYRWVVPDFNVGHPQGGTHPGQGGDTMMWGHMSTPVEGKGAVFRRLPELWPGDEAVVDTARFRYYYRVVRVKVVKPEEVRLFQESDTPTLTLITCVPDWVYSHRLIVSAELYRAESLQ